MLQSNHYGIETQKILQEVARINLLQSNHYGIETEGCCLLGSRGGVGCNRTIMVLKRTKNSKLSKYGPVAIEPLWY